LDSELVAAYHKHQNKLNAKIKPVYNSKVPQLDFERLEKYWVEENERARENQDNLCYCGYELPHEHKENEEGFAIS